MSHNAPVGFEGGETGETTYYFDKSGAPVSGENVSSNGKPGQISLVPDLLEQPLNSQQAAKHLHPSTNGNINSENNDNKNDKLCGFGSFQPEWLQKYASKKSFMVVFSVLAIIQSMCWAYFTATITTLEKRFKISSQTAGIVMTGNEMSQIIFSLILAYYAGNSHRPRWMAAGVLISAFSCFVLASPHFFYGPGNDALSLTEEFQDKFETLGTSNESSLFSSTTATPFPKGLIANKSQIQICRRGSNVPQSTLTDCEDSDTSIAPLILIFFSQFVSGIGVLLFYTLGGPYLDDNIKKTKSPMLFAITMAMRLVGPTLGFLFAGFCLQLYISPMLTPTITNKHPQWLGAWWLGWVVLGILMILTSFLIALFPRELPRASFRKQLSEAVESSTVGPTAGSQVNLNRAGSKLVLTSEAASGEDGRMPRISEMPKAVKSLITNKINLFNNMAGVFYIFSALGYWTYMPKYLETIFMQTAVNASVISGVVSITFQAVGLLVSGALISKYQPSARLLAGWNVFLGFVYVIVKFSFTQMGCDPGELAFGERSDITGQWNLTTACNQDCNCKSSKVFPVCHTEMKQVYYSACHAGCTSEFNETLSNCSCISDPMATVTVGTCNEGCFSTFILFLGVNALIKLLDSSGRIGNMLVSYRCVDPKDKSLAIGFSIFLISILAMLPSPILFGKIFDAACVVWGTKCGARGNCWLYDGQKLRYWFNLFAAAFTFLGAVFDCLVWYYVKDLDLYDEDKNVRNRIESAKLKSMEKSKK